MNSRRLLRWYPRAWRQRYGDELLDVIEQTTAGRRLPIRMRFDVARNGVKQRFVSAGLTGDASPGDRVTGGSLLVLWMFGAVVIAGIGLQKYSEHWQDVAHGSLRWVADASFIAVQGLAAIAAFILLLAGVAGLPALARFLAQGGWPKIRRRFWIAATSCATAIGAMGAVVLWAHHLTSAQRNGGSHPYTWAAMGFALLIAVTIASLAALVSRAARAVELPLGVLRFHGALAIALEITMGLIAIATASWWMAVDHITPWFFQNGRIAGTRSVVDATMPIVLGIFVLATAIGSIGVRRVRQGLRSPD